MRKKGFTLIELLVVISIIAVLLSILMPALSKAKKMARMVICSNNLHQIAIGLNSYAAGNDGYYMERPDHWVNSAFWDAGGSTGPDLRQILLDHVSMKSEDLLFCPAAMSISENMGQKPGYNSNAISLLTQKDYELWSKHFFIDSGGSVKFYSVGYNIFAGPAARPVMGCYRLDMDLLRQFKHKSRTPRSGCGQRLYRCRLSVVCAVGLWFLRASNNKQSLARI